MAPKLGSGVRSARAALLLLSVTASMTAKSSPCEAPAQFPRQPARPGHVDFMDAADLQPLKDALPEVESAALKAVLSSPDTMWYDEASMVFLYQDSVESVVGARANCVGRKVGEQNANDPGIHKLVKYFGPDYKFMYPFRKAAGTDNVTNARILNFWSPPRGADGKALPVRWWQDGARGHWHWLFPVGTLIGEILYEKGPDGRWYAFEIRTRQRYLDGWAVDVLRPFTSAEALAQAITTRRPDWAQSTNLTQVVTHLRTKTNLTPYKLTSQAFGKIFPPISGALDQTPAIADGALVEELLTTNTFKSCEGTIWKESGQGLETYAPGSQGDFGIVPKGYEMGMIPVNEVSCNRCHEHTGHWLADLEIDVMLYGEVWGEDRIFTWHLFQPNERIYDTWDDTQGSRKLNPALQEAGLVRQGKPSSGDTLYKSLPVPYGPNPG